MGSETLHTDRESEAQRERGLTRVPQQVSGTESWCPSPSPFQSPESPLRLAGGAPRKTWPPETPSPCRARL